ncbi:MAG: multidrug efflux SMR transporter [Hyphomicrobiaceae bacterium]|nr:multidrug efflux SMR transporter [Hyphomicrobiaceae bacterium]
MAWVILAISIAFEVLGTTMMKLSQGLTVLWPSIGVFVCYAGSLAGVTIVLKYIELSITYAIWSGVGTVATAIIGMTYFKEPVTLLKIACIGLVIAGVVGLQLASQGVRE